jgi:signal peptidase I
MEPAYYRGDILMVSNWKNRKDNGDVIVFNYKGDKELCSSCSAGHEKLKGLNIETKWNKKVVSLY